jgi:hypothetical protein
VPLLNQPIDYEPGREEEWTPTRGLIRATLRAGLVAAGLALLTAPLAIWLPYMVIIAALRAPLAFGIAWLLLKVVQSAAGMCDWRCNALAIGLTGLVLLTHHVLFAIHGTPDFPHGFGDFAFPASFITKVVPLVGGLRIGWSWLSPFVIGMVTLLPLTTASAFAIGIGGRG